MLGSTFSSPEQLISSVGQMGSAAGFASTPWTGGAGAAVGMGAGLLSGYYGIQSGFAENATEAGDRRIQSFKDLIAADSDKSLLNKTIDELIDRSKIYWKKQGWSKEKIDAYLKGEEGKNHAINDYLVGLTKRLVDENGKPYASNGSPRYDEEGDIINAKYANPITSKAVENAELYSTQGLQALYDADNARTVVGNLF